MIQKLGRTKKVIKVGKIRENYDVLTAEEKRIYLIGDKTKISLVMMTSKRELDTRRLKA